MAGLPGAFDRYDIPGLRRMLDRYREVSPQCLRDNLARFLRAVIPVAEEVGCRMAIRTDDPPRPLMGLPRTVSNADDLAFITEAVDSVANGITLCSGSLGAGPNNDVPAIARQFASRIHYHPAGRQRHPPRNRPAPCGRCPPTALQTAHTTRVFSRYSPGPLGQPPFEILGPSGRAATAPRFTTRRYTSASVAGCERIQPGRRARGRSACGLQNWSSAC